MKWLTNINLWAFFVYLQYFLYLRTSALAFIFPNASRCQFPRSYFRVMQPILQNARNFFKKSVDTLL